MVREGVETINRVCWRDSTREDANKVLAYLALVFCRHLPFLIIDRVTVFVTSFSPSRCPTLRRVASLLLRTAV